MIAISTVITRAQRIFKDLQSATIVDYINEVHDELCRDIPQILDTEDITLTAGTQDYALNELTLQVYHAEYWTNASTRRPMNAFDVPGWNLQNPNWRAVGQNQPTYYAVWRNETDNILVLHPTPASSTVSSYPFVRLYVSRGEALDSGDNLPKNLGSADLYVFGVAMRYALDRVPAKYNFYKARYDEAFAREIRAKQINIKAPPKRVMDHLPRITRL